MTELNHTHDVTARSSVKAANDTKWTVSGPAAEEAGALTELT